MGVPRPPPRPRPVGCCPKIAGAAIVSNANVLNTNERCMTTPKNRVKNAVGAPVGPTVYQTKRSTDTLALEGRSEGPRKAASAIDRLHLPPRRGLRRRFGPTI